MAKITKAMIAEAELMNEEFEALMLDMASTVDTDINTEVDAAYEELKVLEAEDMVEPESVAEEIVVEALEEASAEIEVVLEETPVEPAATPDVQVYTAGDFDARLAAISEEDAIAKAIEIAAQIDQRAEFERAKGNETIQKHLAKSRKQLATPRAARVVIACNVDIAEINRSVHEGVCYNVYALGKLADIITALSGGVLGNAVNIACMKSLFQFRAGGAVFNGEMAKAAVSDKIRVDVGVRGMLVRHSVSASTASTQASSTMQALTTLFVVARTGSQKNPVFTLTDTDIVAKLDHVVMAKAA